MFRENLPIGVLNEDKVILYDKDVGRKFHEENHYGEYDKQGNLVLSSVEALYLVDKGRLRVLDKGGKELCVNELVLHFTKYDPNFWIKYLVYSDLRRRGYVIKWGTSTLALYRRGADPDYEASKYIVYVITEGRKLDFKELERISDQARRLRKELILAVVDRQGEIAYYTVNTLSL